MRWFFDILTTALYCILIQNFVFSGGYGSSESIRIATKPRKLLAFSAQITFFTTTTSLICRWLDYIPEIDSLDIIGHTVIYALVLFSVYILSYFILAKIVKVSSTTHNRLGVAAFNTLVLAIPLINRISAYNIYEVIGSGLGAGIAFILAVYLIKIGDDRISALESIPKSFKGTPIMFIYVALLSLAFTGFAGRSLFI